MTPYYKNVVTFRQVVEECHSISPQPPSPDPDEARVTWEPCRTCCSCGPVIEVLMDNISCTLDNVFDEAAVVFAKHLSEPVWLARGPFALQTMLRATFRTAAMEPTSEHDGETPSAIDDDDCGTMDALLYVPFITIPMPSPAISMRYKLRQHFEQCFHEVLVPKFQERIARYPVGICVQLNEMVLTFRCHYGQPL
jgi:hypothetical protein